MAGLPGMLADTLWLLLVSLRTVYQLAAVYDQPLTGKDGVKMAYELLANADLSKMQEKQALLAGIGVGKGLLDSAQNRGLHNELKNLGLKNNNVNYYAEQIDNIASQVGIDLDQVDLSWIRRLLPASAVIIGMRYNSLLIEEVIGVAQATFAPQPKMANRAITDDTGSEVAVQKMVEKTEENDKDKPDDSRAENSDTEKQSEKKEEQTDSEEKTSGNAVKSDDKATTDSKHTDSKEATSKEKETGDNTTSEQTDEIKK